MARKQPKTARQVDRRDLQRKKPKTTLADIVKRQNQISETVRKAQEEGREQT